MTILPWLIITKCKDEPSLQQMKRSNVLDQLGRHQDSAWEKMLTENLVIPWRAKLTVKKQLVCLMVDIF